MPDAKTWLRPVSRTEVPDVWAEAVRRAEADPRISRGRTFVPAIAVAAAVVIGLVLFGLSGLRSNGLAPVSTPEQPLATFAHPASLPIAVDYPSEWYAAAAKSPPPTQTGGFVTSLGLMVSNTAAAVPQDGDSSRPGYVPANPDLPASFVTVSIFHPNVTTNGPAPMPDSQLPLSMANAKVAPGPGNVRFLEAVVGGTPLEIRVEAGPAASPADLAMADAIVATIRPTGHTNPPITAISSTTHVLARPASEIAAAGGYVWIAEGASDIIQKMDPSTGAVVGSWTAPGTPAWLAAGDGVIWVAVSETGADDVVIGINTQTDDTYSVIHGMSGPLVQTDEGLWGFEYRSPGPSWLELVNPQTGAEVRHVDVESQPFDLAASGGAVWSLDAKAGSVDLISEDGSVSTVTDHSAGTWLAATASGVYFSAWTGDVANDPNGPATSAFASFDAQVQPFGDIYNFRPMVVAGGRVWFVAGPHDANVTGLCGMSTVDALVDRCADISVSLEGIHDPVAYDPQTNTLWAIAYGAPKLYEVNAS